MADVDNIMAEDQSLDYPRHAQDLVREQINVAGIGTPRGLKIDEIAVEDIDVIFFDDAEDGDWIAILQTNRNDGRLWVVAYTAGDEQQNAGCDVASYLLTHGVFIEGVV